MTEKMDVSGRSGGEGDAADHDSWASALRRRALAHAIALPRNPRPVVGAAIVCAVLAHLLLALWLRDLMRTRPAAADSDRIAVRLIDAPPPETALPEPPPPSAPAFVPARAAHAASVSPNAAATMSAATSPVSAPLLHLYNPDGSIALPPEKGDGLTARIVPDAFVAQRIAPSPLMAPHRPYKIRPNHFAAAWKSGETIDFFDHLNEFIDEHLTVKKEMTTPWGSKIKCEATYLFIVAVGGCGWGFPPPPGGRPTEHWKPATELDER